MHSIRCWPRRVCPDGQGATSHTFKLHNSADVTGSSAVFSTTPAFLQTLAKPGEKGWVSDCACMPAVTKAEDAAQAGSVLPTV